MDKLAWNLVHRESLLQQLADALKQHENRKPGASAPRVTDLKVTIFVGKRKKVEIFGLALALDYLVNDIYWDDENGDWSHADRLTVETY